MKTLKWIAVLAALILALAVAAYSLLEPVDETPPVLHNHPDAYWSGAQDGGVFFEITDADPPRYFLEIRYENGTLWAQGWVTGQEQGLTSSDFLGYYGGDTVELKSGKQLRLENQDGTPIDMD